MPSRWISVHGGREHNLKNISVEIPREKLVVLTGPSGCGKTSLAYDTLYAEGQRRYLESLSVQMRRYAVRWSRPEVDFIEGLSPSLAVDQRRGKSLGGRSTVGSLTEIFDLLRLVFSAIGIPHDPETGQRLERLTPSEISGRLMNLPEKTRVILLAPMPESMREDVISGIREFQRQGFLRFRVDGAMWEGEELLDAGLKNPQNVEVVIDRLVVRPEALSRFADSLEIALRICPHEVRALVQVPESESYQFLSFFTQYRNPETGFVLDSLSPQMFSSYGQEGSCPQCCGRGVIPEFELSLLVPHPEVSVADGAVKTWHSTSDKVGKEWVRQDLVKLLFNLGVSPELPWKDLPDSVRDDVVSEVRRLAFEALEEEPVASVKKRLERLCSLKVCPSCGGSGLCAEALAVTLPHVHGEKSWQEISRSSIEDLLAWWHGVVWPEAFFQAGLDLQQRLLGRLSCLVELGLPYLSLSRKVETLSGGEFQRVRLATQLGGGLSGVLYVLDEPTIGLHPSDNEKLIYALQKLKKNQNSVLVVEHDREVIEAADYVVDMGPGAGALGGEILATGSPLKLCAEEASPTGQWLSGKRNYSLVKPKYKGSLKKMFDWLTIVHPTEHNLKGDNVSFPLGCFVCLTGVGGSGKSTLMYDILYPALRQKYLGYQGPVGAHDNIVGGEFLQRVVMIDQSPLGRSGRSTPATIMGIMDILRQMYASLPLSRQRGYTSSRFSFNRPGGRCDRCEGTGQLAWDMNFLSDVSVVCDACKGARFNRETLEVAWRGKNIAEALSLSVSEALAFFKDVPKLRSLLQMMKDLGLGYLTLDRRSETLSGGEAQRVKLAAELAFSSSKKTLYLLDEPTTGLYFSDIDRFMQSLIRLRDQGHSILCIEHQTDVIAMADYVVDLGPCGGDKGGYVLATGTPQEMKKLSPQGIGKWLS